MKGKKNNSCFWESAPKDKVASQRILLHIWLKKRHEKNSANDCISLYICAYLCVSGSPLAPNDFCHAHLLPAHRIVLCHSKSRKKPHLRLYSWTWFIKRHSHASIPIYKQTVELPLKSILNLGKPCFYVCRFTEWRHWIFKFCRIVLRFIRKKAL